MKLNSRLTDEAVLSGESTKPRKGLVLRLCAGLAAVLAAGAFVLTIAGGDFNSNGNFAVLAAEQATDEVSAQVEEYEAKAPEQTAQVETEKKATEAVTTKAAASTEAATQAPVKTAAKMQAAPEPFNSYSMYTSEEVNLRSGAGVENPTIAEIPAAEEVTVTGEFANGWYPVSWQGKIGWISGRFVTSQKPVVVTTVVTTEANTQAPTESATVEATTNSGEPRTEYVGRFKVTAYCSCEKCCGTGATGQTASGTIATEGRTIAASSNYAFGTQLMFNGNVYTVEDRGGAINGNVIDLYFASHEAACAWGVQYCDVYRLV